MAQTPARAVAQALTLTPRLFVQSHTLRPTISPRTDLRTLWTQRAPRASRSPVSQVELSFKTIFRRPDGRVVFRKWLWVSLAIGLAGWTYSSLVFPPFVAAVQARLREIPPDMLKTILAEAQESETYLPIPFTAHRGPRKPYSPTSPTWRMFMSISRDRERLDRIYSDVRRGVQQVFEQAWGSYYGAITHMTDSFVVTWNTEPPFSPIVQKELVVKDERDGTTSLILRERELPWPVGRVMLNVLYPWHIFHAAKAYLHVLVYNDLKAVTQRLDDPYGNGVAPVNVLRSYVPPPPPPLPARGRDSAQKKAPVTHQPAPSNNMVPAISSSSSSDLFKQVEAAIGPYTARMYERSADARKAFHYVLMRKRARVPDTDISACVPVSGACTIYFEAGFVVLWVEAWWDPKRERVQYFAFERKKGGTLARVKAKGSQYQVSQGKDSSESKDSNDTKGPNDK